MAIRTRHSRYPWLAVLLSFLVPGLGQIYATRACRGLLFFAIYSLWNSLVYISSIQAMRQGFSQSWFPGLLLVLLISLAWSIFIMIDAFIQARKNRHADLQSYNRVIVYLVVIALYLGIQAGVSSTLDQIVLKAYRIPTQSMEPAILQGDFLLADKLFYCRHNPERGDIVIFIKPGTKNITFIKRVIGLPGDSVKVGQEIIIDGEPLVTPWLEKGTQFRALNVPSNDSIYIVPQNHYFMLGDQIDNSQDSRDFGTVPRRNIVGKAAVIYFSWSTEPGWWNIPARIASIRWHRIGRVIK